MCRLSPAWRKDLCAAVRPTQPADHLLDQGIAVGPNGRDLGLGNLVEMDAGDHAYRLSERLGETMGRPRGDDVVLMAEPRDHRGRGSFLVCIVLANCNGANVRIVVGEADYQPFPHLAPGQAGSRAPTAVVQLHSVFTPCGRSRRPHTF